MADPGFSGVGGRQLRGGGDNLLFGIILHDLLPLDPPLFISLCLLPRDRNFVRILE